MAKIIEPFTQCDLNEITVLDLCLRLNVTPHGECLVAGMCNWDVASKIAAKLKMLICIVPDAMLVSPGAWAIVTETSGVAWSKGAF